MKRIIFLITIIITFANVGFAQECNPNGNNDSTPNPPHQQNPLDDTTTSGGISADPNEIIGPTGYDSLRWVSISDVLTYTIMFENDPEFATANAQKVDVRFKIDDKTLMKGFGLGTYGFANYSWQIEDNPAAYQNRLDLRDSMYIYVDLLAGLDVVKQEAFWTFNSIDPETGLNPWQVDRGMLPVNDSTHVGEGFVTFRLKPNENLKTGDTISIAANIVFDQNDTIPTNRWCNMIDAGMPTSKVKGKVDSKNENLYHITLQASDDEGGSGLKRVVLYQANNFGIYEEYAVCPVDTVIDFEAEPGRQYKFFSLAEDNVGNREPLKEDADFIININAAPTDIALSDSIFQDDIMAEGFIAELTSEDIDGSTFTYALAEGEGAIHNDLFQITGSQLQAKNTFKCAEEDDYKIRISTTDEGGLSFSKSFTLTLKHVLEKPKPDTLAVSICEGDIYDFHGVEYEKSGTYYYTVGYEFMCDSVYVLQLTVLPRLEAPIVTVEGDYTLVSSAAKGNQWFTIDGYRVEGATDQKFTPTEEGIYYVCASNGSCFSEPSNAYHVKLSTDIDLTLDLKKGWNWVSSSLSEMSWRQPQIFLNPIVEDVERLVGRTSELHNNPALGLVGNMSAIEPTEGYKVLVTNSVSNTWSGNAFKPSEKPIALKKGWNWIGYIPVSGNSLESALSNYAPSENDVIKNLTDFATYEGGKWVGTLTTMKPGEGYLYYSGKESDLTYSSSNVFSVSEYSSMAKAASVNSAPWVVESNTYPDNMNIIANVYSKESLAPEGLYTIGAFVGNACVGMGMYVDGKLFLTANGSVEYDQTVTFKAYNNATGMMYKVAESLPFDNTIYGSISVPQTLTIGDETGIMQISASDYNIYPKPLHDRMFINGSVENIKSITLITMGGARVIQTDGYNANGINVSYLAPGNYVVVLSTTTGTYVDKVIKTF